MRDPPRSPDDDRSLRPPRSTTPTWTTTLANDFLNEMMANAPQYARAEIAEQRAEHMNKKSDEEPAEEEEENDRAENMKSMGREVEVTAGMKRKGKPGRSRGARANHSRRGSARDREDEGRARGT